MTIPDALPICDAFLANWQSDRLVALRNGEAERAHDCQLVIAALEYLRSQFVDEKAAAA